MAAITDDGAYHIDLSPNSGFAGALQSLHPEGLEFDDKIKGSGNCAWQISFSAKDEDGSTIVVPTTPPEHVPFVGPYRSYYRLRYGATTIMAGPITNTNTKLDDEYVSVVGKTWEHYFERWQYPFDPRVTPTDDVDHTQDFQFDNALMGNEALPGSGQPLNGTGLAYECYQRDVVLIIADVVGNAMLNVPYRKTFDISNLAVGLSGIHANQQFALGDTSYMDSFINSLTEIGQGVDWWMSWDQKFFWATPYRFGDPGNPTIAMTIDNTVPLPVGGIGFENNGPDATHVFGKGAGSASQTQMARAYGSPLNQAKFSRLDKSYDFGDFRNKNTLTSRTQKQLAYDLQPQHRVTLQVNPAQIAGWWEICRKGRALWITYDLRSNYIDSLQQIVSYSCKDENNSGNMLVDLTLEQRYDLPVDAGLPEG